MEDARLVEGVGLHQTGNLDGAAEIYAKIIDEVPEHFDANHLLGVVALQKGQLTEAHRLISYALTINPLHAPAIGNLGTVLLRGGDLEEARSQFARGIELEPDSLTALTNLGMVLRQLDRSRDALIPLRHAHFIHPGSATICNLLGACLLDMGNAPAAAKLFASGVDADPSNANGWANLAVALTLTGEHERALEYAEKAVSMDPRSSAALAALAAVRFENGQIDAAVEFYRRSVSLPDPSVQTLCAFGNVLLACGLCDEATEQFRKAIALDGNNAMARWKLAMAQCRPIYASTAALLKSRQAFATCLEDLDEWFKTMQPMEAYTAVGSSQPFFIAYQPYNNRALLKTYGRLCAEWIATLPNDPHMKIEVPPPGISLTPQAGGKLRVGIASAHIRDHSVWNAIAKGWVNQIDKARFEIYLFQLGAVSDEETRRAKQAADRFEEGPRSLFEWACALRNANLDVLIYPEIGMDPVTTQLASMRLAPVQAATWGHPETTGLPAIDLYLSSDAFESVGSQDNYTEKLVTLPNLGVYVEPLAPPRIALDLRSIGLPTDEPLLLCPGMPFKYSPLNDTVWVAIARTFGSTNRKRSLWTRFTNGRQKSSTGRLVFFRSRSTTMDELLEQRLRKAFCDGGVDFDATVCMIPHLDRARFFALMQRSTLMLDTLGFSGFNTALQAIECGLPILAREGQFMRGRLASGILRRMEMSVMIAENDDEFIRLAGRLAANPTECNALRAEIRSRRAILFQDAAPVRALEHCLENAVKQSRHQHAS